MHAIQTIQITNNEFSVNEIWELYRKEHDGRMKERYARVLSTRLCALYLLVKDVI